MVENCTFVLMIVILHDTQFCVINKKFMSNITWDLYLKWMILSFFGDRFYSDVVFYMSLDFLPWLNCPCNYWITFISACQVRRFCEVALCRTWSAVIVLILQKKWTMD